MVNCCEILVAFILPPLAVGMRTGCSCKLVINFLLTCLFWLPGFIHAIVVMADDDKNRIRIESNSNIAPPSQVTVVSHSKPAASQPPSAPAIAYPQPAYIEQAPNQYPPAQYPPAPSQQQPQQQGMYPPVVSENPPPYKY